MAGYKGNTPFAKTLELEDISFEIPVPESKEEWVYMIRPNSLGLRTTFLATGLRPPPKPSSFTRMVAI